MLPSKVNGQSLIINGQTPLLEPQSAAVAPQQGSQVSGISGATPTTQCFRRQYGIKVYFRRMSAQSGEALTGVYFRLGSNFLHAVHLCCWVGKLTLPSGASTTVGFEDGNWVVDCSGDCGKR